MDELGGSLGVTASNVSLEAAEAMVDDFPLSHSLVIAVLDLTTKLSCRKSETLAKTFLESSPMSLVKE